MDSEEEARDYDAMDHAGVNACFCEDFLNERPALDRVLDVGTGTAQIPIELCHRVGNAQVIAIDLAESMLARGVENVARAGLSASISLSKCDAKSLPHESGSFSAVISNSIVHHIPDPQPVLAEMLRVLRPGGLLFVRDLIRPEDDRAVCALVEQYAGSANEHQRALFDASLRAAFTVDEVKEMAQSLGIPEGSVKQTSDRHFTLVYRANREVV